MTRYLMGSCIYDKISWISHPKCQLFIGQEIYEGLFIFHVIYFNFILSFLLKNKIIHGEIWLVENLCFYRCPLETSSLTFETSGYVSRNMVERVLYFWLEFDLIILDFHNKQINLIMKIKYDSQKWKFINQFWLRFIKSNDRIFRSYSGPNKIYLYTRIATNTLTGLQDFIFFTRSGHCNILF